MTIDPARAALVSQAYRYATNEDAMIFANSAGQAIEITIDTNLDATGGAAMSNAVFLATKNQAQTFTLDIEDVMFLEDWGTAPARYTLNFSRHPATGNAAYTVIGATVDYFANTTTLTVRG